MTFSLATQDLVFQQELNKYRSCFHRIWPQKKIKQKKNCRNSKATTAYHRHEIDQKSRFKQVWSAAPVSQNPDPGFHYLVLQFVLVLKQSSYACMYTTHTHTHSLKHTYTWDCIYTEGTSVYSLSWQAFRRVSAEFDSGEISGWAQSLARNSHPLTRQPRLTVLSLACSRSVPVSLLIQYYDRP